MTVAAATFKYTGEIHQHLWVQWRIEAREGVRWRSSGGGSVGERTGHGHQGEGRERVQLAIERQCAGRQRSGHEELRRCDSGHKACLGRLQTRAVVIVAAVLW